MLLCLLGLSAPARSARAVTFDFDNFNPITTPDSGQAALYPSQINVPLLLGAITGVRVTLHNISHTLSSDYDILLVGPAGQRTLLMSDCGGAGLNNVTLTFSETGPLLPSGGQIPSGIYRPSNYGTVGDTFPPNPAQFYTASLAVFNNTSPSGAWRLFVVDDAAQDVGSITGGWTLSLDYSAFNNAGNFAIPAFGMAATYPSQVDVAGLLGTVRKVRVFLSLSHTFPDDVDILLVGPGGQNAIVMSDVGGDPDATGVILVLDDAAASDLPDAGPLVDGTFRPTNIGAGDSFPMPAPAPAGTSVLSVFNGTNPNGTWRLYVVDDNAQDMGQISWSVAFDMETPTLANISTRLRVETGDNVLIGGFIVTGTQSKNVIVRAIGPSLPLAGALGNPTLELRDGQGGLIRSNDDWETGGQQAGIIATGLAPTNPLESAILITLPANNAGYTAIVRGALNQTGIGVVEVYDLNRTADSKLANISTRGLVQTGDNVLIAGTIVTGGPSQRVLVRALGPSLPVPGPLADPTLELRDAQGALIASNDDWVTGQQADVLATGIPPSNSLDSAIVTTLPAGGASYTAIVRGLNGTTGVALVEVYALN